jgi:HlyD family secretion protein
MKKVFKWGMFIIVVALISGYMYIESTKPFQVEVITVTAHTIAEVIEEEATVVAVNDLSLYALTGGKVGKVRVKEGNQVSKGDLLFEIDNRELGYQIAQLNAQLISLTGQEKQMYPELHPSQIKQQELFIQQAQIQHQAAVEDYERVKALYEAGAISFEQYQQSERTVNILENALAQQIQALDTLKDQYVPTQGIDEQFAGQRQLIQTQIDSLNYQLANTRIYAPVTGVVTSLQIEKGMVVPAGFQALTLFEQDKYELEVMLLTTDVVEIELGMEVNVKQERKTGDITFTGKVERIAPAAVDTISVLGLKESRIKVIIGIEKADIPEVVELRPGFVFDVAFTVHEEHEKIVLPKTAIFTHDGSDAIWVVRDGLAELQHVKTGFETSDRVVIEQGINVGEQVIRNPRLSELKQGLVVEIINF